MEPYNFGIDETKNISSYNESDLCNIAHKIYRYYTNKDFKGTVKWSNRLKTSGANIRFNLKNGDATIHLNLEYAKKFGYKELVEILKHELTHFYLYSQGFIKHGHGKEFHRVLLEVFNSTRLKAKFNIDMYKFQYSCKTCGAVHNRTKRINKRIYCRKCVSENNGIFKKQFEMVLN